jgi:hypothetical protein
MLRARAVAGAPLRVVFAAADGDCDDTLDSDEAFALVEQLAWAAAADGALAAAAPETDTAAIAPVSVQYEQLGASAVLAAAAAEAAATGTAPVSVSVAALSADAAARASARASAGFTALPDGAAISAMNAPALAAIRAVRAAAQLLHQQLLALAASRGVPAGTIRFADFAAWARATLRADGRSGSGSGSGGSGSGSGGSGSGGSDSTPLPAAVLLSGGLAGWNRLEGRAAAVSALAAAVAAVVPVPAAPDAGVVSVPSSLAAVDAALSQARAAADSLAWALPLAAHRGAAKHRSVLAGSSAARVLRVARGEDLAEALRGARSDPHLRFILLQPDPAGGLDEEVVSALEVAVEGLLV